LAANEFKGPDFPFSQIVCTPLLTPKYWTFLGPFFLPMVYQVSGSEKNISKIICSNQKSDFTFAKSLFH
jgi:hypothetical protein